MKKLLIIILFSNIIISCTQIKIGNINEDLGVPPDRPSNLTIQYVGNDLILDWSDNIESDFKEYQIYREITRSSPYLLIEKNKLLSTTSVSYFIDNNVTYTNNNYRYEYEIRAVDLEGLKSAYRFKSYWF